MNWPSFPANADLAALIAASASQPQVIFKHSPTCGISAGAKHRLDASYEPLAAAAALYLVDVLSERPLSQAIAAAFGVHHQSPQVRSGATMKSHPKRSWQQSPRPSFVKLSLPISPILHRRNLGQPEREGAFGLAMEHPEAAASRCPSYRAVL
jgi:bacillithiol system protein YtxJ